MNRGLRHKVRQAYVAVHCEIKQRERERERERKKRGNRNLVDKDGRQVVKTNREDFTT